MRKDHPLIPTFTGKRVNPMNLCPEDVCIEDIAHHLSNICRYTGATPWHYSVAQHSCFVWLESPLDQALAALLHDAPETYISDLSHPIKYRSGLGKQFRRVESRVAAVVEGAFGLASGALHSPEIVAADDKIFQREWKYLIERAGRGPGPVQRWTQEFAEQQFLSAYAETLRLAA